MKICLILTLIIFIVVFRVNYVETIKCYVCNSHQQKGCLTESLDPSHLKDCNQVSENKFKVNEKAIQEVGASNSSSQLQNDFNRRYSNGSRASQCSKLIFSVEGNERVVRDCSGVVSKGKTSDGGCLRVLSSAKSDQCLCESDSCNSGHRRLHPTNFWLNVLLPVIISLTNLLLN